MDAHSLLVFALIALGLGVAGILGYLEHQRSEELRATGKRARGLVVRNELHPGRNSVLRPVVRFTTQGGRVIEAEYTKGLALAVPRFSTGAVIWVAYDERDPYDFLILSTGNFA